MSFAKEISYVSGVTPISAAFMNLFQELLSAYVSPNFVVEQQSTTQIRVPAGNDHVSVAISIGGQWRRRDTNAVATVSGGAGTKNIYATADTANDLFALEVTSGASGATLSRKIGEVDWSGTTIQAIRQEFPISAKLASAGLAAIANSLVPVGSGMVWYYTSAPAGHLLCQGQAVSRAANPQLHALAQASGYPHGAGDGSTTFNLPDLRRRFPIGKADAGAVSTLGETGGSWDHTHTNPSTSSGGTHSHSVDPPNTNTGSSGAHTHGDSFAVGSETTGDGAGPSAGMAGGGHRHALSGSVSSSGSSHDHSVNIASFTTASGASHSHAQGSTGSANPPYIVVNWIIRAA